MTTKQVWSVPAAVAGLLLAALAPAGSAQGLDLGHAVCVDGTKLPEESGRVMAVVVPGLSLGFRVREEGSGLRVERVLPGGQADRAGIRAGDLITDVSGHALRGDPEIGATEMGPLTAALLDAACRAAGAPLRIGYRRGNSRGVAELQPASAAPSEVIRILTISACVRAI